MERVDTVEEFDFVSKLPQRKTKEGLLAQIKRFFKETDGGAIPVALAAKFMRVSPQRVHQLIEAGQLNAFRSGRTILISIKSIDEFNQKPKSKGGRPPKKTS